MRDSPVNLNLNLNLNLDLDLDLLVAVTEEPILALNYVFDDVQVHVHVGRRT
jgi:hypothetical protein